MSPSDVQVALVTAPDLQVAEALARGLVEEGLAACVNMISGVRSLYRWEGVLQDDSEVLLLIKTRRDRCAELERRLGEMHPYDVPELLLFDADGGSEAYLDWVRSEVAL